MNSLPTGTVTFLFTDIEGSTRLWEQNPELAHTALARHDRIVEEAVENHGGTLVRPRGEGDSRFAVFPRASDAVAAAARLQRALFDEPWPTPTPLRVRMALHTGEADLREGDYYGIAVNRCARLRSAAHGGQTLLTQTTFDLVCDSLPPGVELQDLGEHVLKDVQRSEHIFQLAVSGVPSDFPPLNISGTRPNNLPAEATHLVGREREVEAIRGLLLQPRPTTRLITLTGPGGTGKTRLALEVARALLQASGSVDVFRDGIFFVTLASIREPAMVASTIAQSLSVVRSPATMSRSETEVLKDYLRDKDVLLLLDNLEQVMEAAPLVGELLEACPNLKVLVTSREVLHLYGEKEFPVPPLSLPDPKHLPTLEQITRYEAVRLFIDRATLVKPDFRITNENAPAVAEICYRLDGLPLAIELAAARVKLLPPAAMLQRLQSRLQVLTGGARNLPARQQTLRGAIEWGHDLLNEGEKKLFRRIAVFDGGCTLEAVEGVCNAHADIEDVLDTLSSLVDKSLLKQQEEVGEQASGEARFWMLGTIKEYALERLEASGEAQQLQHLHAHFYLALSEQAEQYLFSSDPQAWSGKLEAEYHNITAAVSWLISEKDAEPALRMAAAIFPFWFMRGHGGEARTWAELALSLPGAEKPTPARAKALVSAASMSWPQGDLDAARAWSMEGASLSKQVGDKQSLAQALTVLAVSAYLQGDVATAGPILEEALALTRELGVRRFFAPILLARGQVAMALGDYALARVRLEEALAEHRANHNKWEIAQTLNSLGDLARLQGDSERATQLYQESLALFRELNAKGDIPAVVHNLGHVALARRDLAQARALFMESLSIHRDMGSRPGIAESLAGLAGADAVEAQLSAGQSEEEAHGKKEAALRSARLFGASDALRGTDGPPNWPAERADYERNLAISRAQLDTQTWQSEWEAGRDMGMEAAIACVMGEKDGG